MQHAPDCENEQGLCTKLWMEAVDKISDESVVHGSNIQYLKVRALYTRDFLQKVENMKFSMRAKLPCSTSNLLSAKLFRVCGPTTFPHGVVLST
jgi:hypothetical protein